MCFLAEREPQTVEEDFLEVMMSSIMQHSCRASLLQGRPWWSQRRASASNRPASFSGRLMRVVLKRVDRGRLALVFHSRWICRVPGEDAIPLLALFEDPHRCLFPEVDR